MNKKNATSHETVHRINLDHASTTPVCREALTAMIPYFSDEWANPGAIYAEGVQVKRVVEECRQKLARLFRVRSEGIVFTSGGTESNNLALLGLLDALHNNGRSYKTMEVITISIEHPSVLKSLESLEKRGVTTRFVTIDHDGRIDESDFKHKLNERTVLVTCAYVNSEVGVIQDIKRIARLIRIYVRNHSVPIYFHTDASQAPLWLPCALDSLGVDLMTIDAGKCYGPKGMGVLVKKQNIPLREQLHGGGQEHGLRSGTENTPLIVGGTRAIMRAQSDFETRSAHVSKLRDTMIKGLIHIIPECLINGSTEYRVANNINVSIPGIDTEFAVISLSEDGICAATKSACGSGKGRGSKVVREMTHDEERSLSTLRFTLGESTTNDDIKRALFAIGEHVAKMRIFQDKIDARI